MVQSKQPCIPLHKKCLMLIDLIQQRSVKMSFLSPKILLTKNRKDIEYRVGFLRSVLESGLSLQNTLYYQFIADHDKTITEDAEMASKEGPLSSNSRLPIRSFVLADYSIIGSYTRLF